MRGALLGGLDIDRLMGSSGGGNGDDHWINVFELGFLVGLYDALPYHECIHQEDPMLADLARQVYVELNAQSISALFFQEDLSILPRGMIMNGGRCVELAYSDLTDPRKNVFVHKNAINRGQQQSIPLMDEDMGLEIDAVDLPKFVMVPDEAKEAIKRKLELSGSARRDPVCRTLHELRDMGLEAELPANKKIFDDVLRQHINAGVKLGDQIVRAVLHQMQLYGAATLKNVLDQNPKI